MDEPAYIKEAQRRRFPSLMTEAGTAGLVSHVMLRKNEVIEILKSLEGLKRKLQMLLK